MPLLDDDKHSCALLKSLSIFIVQLNGKLLITELFFGNSQIEGITMGGQLIRPINSHKNYSLPSFYTHHESADFM